MVTREKQREKKKKTTTTFIFERTSVAECIGSIILLESNHHVGVSAEGGAPRGENIRVKFPSSCLWGQPQSSMALPSKPLATCENAHSQDFGIHE